MDDETVIFSPDRGFWSDKGWQQELHRALRINVKTPLQMNFQKAKNAKRIRLSKCSWLNKSGILQWALTLTEKVDGREALRGHLNVLLGKHKKVSKDDRDTIERIAKNLTFEALYDLIRQHSQSDIWPCYEYNSVLIVPTSENYPAEKPPVIAPYVFAHKMTGRGRGRRSHGQS